VRAEVQGQPEVHAGECWGLGHFLQRERRNKKIKTVGLKRSWFDGGGPKTGPRGARGGWTVGKYDVGNAKIVG